MGTGSAGWLSIHCRAAPRLCGAAVPIPSRQTRAARPLQVEDELEGQSQLTADEAGAAYKHATCREDHRQDETGRRRGGDEGDHDPERGTAERP